MPAWVDGMSTRMTRRSMVFNSGAETDSRFSFIAIANDRRPKEVSCEWAPKRSKAGNESGYFDER
jgi:hypothetical protein